MTLLVPAGTLAGHAIAYAAVSSRDPSELLAATGHRYLPVALVLVALVALAGTIVFVAGRLRDAAEVSLVAPARWLAVRQVGLFVAVEFAERAISGAPLTAVNARGLLLWGVAAQVVVAALAALILRLLVRAAVALSARDKPTTPTDENRLWLPAQRVVLPRPALAGAGSTRSPPSI